MAAGFEGRIQCLEQQLQRYTHAYNTQRELLLQLHRKLHATGGDINNIPPVRRRGGGEKTHAKEEEEEMYTGARRVAIDDAFKWRLVEVLRDPLPPSTPTGKISSSSSYYSSVSSASLLLFHEKGNKEDDVFPDEYGTSQHEGRKGEYIQRDTEKHKSSTNVINNNNNNNNNKPGDHPVSTEEEEINDGSPRSTRSPAATRRAGTAISAQLTKSLAVASADAATRFLEMMRRLWAVYFTHVRTEVRSALRRVDDLFAAFDAAPSEETLANFLEAHQKLGPSLEGILGIHENNNNNNNNNVMLPPGNPLEEEEGFVRQLSLCIAEAISPLLAIALRDDDTIHNNNINNNKHTARSLDNIMNNAASIHEKGRDSNRDARTSPACQETTCVDPFSQGGQQQHQRQRRGVNDNLQGETAVYEKGRTTTTSSLYNYNNNYSNNNYYYRSSPSSSSMRRHATPRFRSDSAPSTNSVNKYLLPVRTRAQSEIIPPAMEEIEKEKEDILLQDPKKRLRQLRLQEQKISFTLVNTVALRNDHGSEAKYYAMNKRLARVRSAILRTKREVDELQRIEEERRAIQEERKARNQRLFQF